jgi:hypothetical protein
MRHQPFGVVALAAVCVAAAVPDAGASSGVPTSDRLRAAPVSAADYVDFKAGYTATTAPDELTTAIASFRLPELTCTEETQAFSLGAGSEPVFGEFRYVAVAYAMCSGGSAEYLLNAHVKPHRHAVQLPASPGQKIRTKITRKPSGRVVAEVINVSRALHVKQAGKPKPSEHDDEIDFGAFPLFLYGDMQEVPEFSPVLVTRAEVGTETASACLADADPVMNVRRDQVTGEVEILPGPVTDCGFSLTFESH